VQTAPAETDPAPARPASIPAPAPSAPSLRPVATRAASLAPAPVPPPAVSTEPPADTQVAPPLAADSRPNLADENPVSALTCPFNGPCRYRYYVGPPREVGVEFRYKFGGPSSEPAATPAAYVPPPVQAPAAPSVAHSYMVFFDFNKSDLTPDAVAIVDQAAKNAGPAKATELTVTGHTDTVGSDAYNMRLSRRRAESVAAELEKQGIPSSEIEIVAKGKHDLLVPTGDGVREPQNRRVQIVYSGGPTA